MKLALILALAPDRHSGRVLSGVMPAHEAVAQVKEAINADSAPDPRYPTLVAFALDSTLREHRFKPTPEQVAAYVPQDFETKLADAESAAKTAIEANASLKADNDALQTDCKTLMDRLKSAEEKLAVIPADLTAATARTEAIRAKLTGISDKINKGDILKLVEEALAA